LAASLVFALRLSQEVSSLRDEVSAERAIARRTAERLASRDSVVELLTGATDRLQLVKLTANAPQSPMLQVYWNQRQRAAVVYATGLAPVPAGRTYCLWIIRNGTPEAVALFDPDGDGKKLIARVEVPGIPSEISAFAVTEEPDGGSPQPTMTPFLVGAVERGTR
jgi:anti-sigma-K factor RskA